MKTDKSTYAGARMPVLFIGHGSPMNAILQNDFTAALAGWGKKLPKPKAILVISAHYLSDGTFITCMEHPKTIYDFYGFPDELYQVEYPAPGSPAAARLARESVQNVQIECDDEWGLDHGSWTILKHMYPKADIPVVEMSLDYSPNNEWHPRSLKYYYDLAAELAPLRDRGVLIIGSGNIVHNLRLIDFSPETAPYDWAVEFDQKVKQDLLNRNHKDLLDCRNAGRTASLAVPTLDHYLPMVCAAALQEQNDPLEFVFEGIQHGSVSMRCFQIG